MACKFPASATVPYPGRRYQVPRKVEIQLSHAYLQTGSPSPVKQNQGPSGALEGDKGLLVEGDVRHVLRVSAGVGILKAHGPVPQHEAPVDPLMAPSPVAPRMRPKTSVVSRAVLQSEPEADAGRLGVGPEEGRVLVGHDLAANVGLLEDVPVRGKGVCGSVARAS